jgi:glutamate formiminotransferase/formiminotetrahydrofolate cyclodeaminase
MQTAYESIDVIEAMVETGNPNSITDAGVGLLCASAAVSGAYLNVLVNASGFEDKESIRQMLVDAETIENLAKERCSRILLRVREKL